ncbi:hypothetical protein HPC49_41155 [Pyxidicoccus fallax]|uniref:Uncharacterized protein n=1 Tax=Pyxidicoccus fallax TaxID=394095 RepID=A0A848LJ60_9BACT|nr:hypothetical protein [Pyxidicoccus fallax]NMO17744.1 hypothetical protein [Pyxidicoccus fallax]NPC84611.1 hypothetical protein [Pyxidicoccus fallax]
MRFLEVSSNTQPSVDMGRHLPLRFTWRPWLGEVVYPLLVLALFCVLPVAFVLDQKVPLSEVLTTWWWLVLVGCGGFLGVGGTLACVLTRLQVEVTSEEVRQRGAGALRGQTWTEPMSHYIGLSIEHRHHPNWLGGKDEYGIYLCHGEDVSRSILLFWGRSERRFRQRLAHYSELLRLGVREEEPEAREELAV